MKSSLLYNLNERSPNMKRHLYRGTDVIPVPTLSAEELAIQADDLAEAEQNATNEADIVERVTEIAEVASDTMTVVSLTPEVGDIEQALVNAVADMAVAGTDGDPEEVISVATDASGAISTEGIATALKSMWQAIVTAIKNMWVGIKHWLTTYFSSLEQNKKHAEALIQKLNGQKGYVPNMKTDGISITDIFNYSNTAGLNLSKLLGGPSQTNQEFQEFVIQATGVQHSVMIPMGKGLVQAYNEFDGNDSSKLGHIVDTLVSKMGDYCKKLGLQEGLSADKGEYAKRVAFMKVVARNWSEKISAQANSPETKVAFLGKVRFEASQMTDFESNARVMYKNDTTPDMIRQVVESRLKFIDALLHLKNNGFKDLEREVEAVQKACEGMLNKIGEDNKQGQAEAKRLMQLSSAYSNWATQPMAKLLQLASRHNKFWLSLAEMVSNNFVEPTAA